MKGPAVLVAALGLYLAGAMQPLAPRFGFWGMQPDFLLAMLAPLSLLATRRGGLLLGFFAGLIGGALPGANMAHYVISRTVGGALGAWVRSLGVEHGPITSAATAISMTIAAQLVLMFLAPPARIGAFLGATMGSAVLNGLLAIPLFALISRVLDPVQR